MTVRVLVEPGAFWFKMVYPYFMSIAEKTVRQSISLPARVARRVKSLAKTSSTSANRIIVDLIECGIEAQEQERKRFFEVADRLACSNDVEEQKRLKEELARMTFGE
jgi:predicted DNA-binding protein